jgi:hypothetical protein
LRDSQFAFRSSPLTNRDSVVRSQHPLSTVHSREAQLCRRGRACSTGLRRAVDPVDGRNHGEHGGHGEVYGASET